MTLRVYRFDPKLRPDYNPQPAVLPPLPHCVLCGECLGEAACSQRKYCPDCKRKMDAARRSLRRRPTSVECP